MTLYKNIPCAFSCFLLFFQGAFGQNGLFNKLAVKDSLVSFENHADLKIAGRGKGVVVIPDTLQIPSAEGLLIGGQTLLEFVGGEGGEGGVLVRLNADGSWDFLGKDLTGIKSLSMGVGGFPEASIHMNTLDGADDHAFVLNSGGGSNFADDRRGFSITGHGNEYGINPSFAGSGHYRAGNVGTGDHNFWTQSYRRLNIGRLGHMRFYGNGLYEIGGSPGSGDPGEFGGHGGINITGNGLNDTHISLADKGHTLTVGGSGGNSREGSFIEVNGSNVDGGVLKVVAGRGDAGDGSILFNTGGADRLALLSDGGIELPGDFYAPGFLSVGSADGGKKVQSGANAGPRDLLTYGGEIDTQGGRLLIGDLIADDGLFNKITLKNLTEGPIGLNAQNEVINVEGGGTPEYLNLAITEIHTPLGTDITRFNMKATTQSDGSELHRSTLTLGAGSANDATGSYVEINGKDADLDANEVIWHMQDYGLFKIKINGLDAYTFGSSNLTLHNITLLTNGGNVYTSSGNISTGYGNITTSSGFFYSHNQIVLKSNTDDLVLTTETDNRDNVTVIIPKGLRLTSPDTGALAGALYKDSDGNVSTTTPSDIRLKNVKGAYARGLKTIAQMEPVTYTYKPTGSGSPESGEHIGFIANEVLKVAPELVTTYRHVQSKTPGKETRIGTDGEKFEADVTDTEYVDRLAFNQPMPSPITVNAIKELHALVADLQGVVEGLQGVVDAQGNRIKELEND